MNSDERDDIVCTVVSTHSTPFSLFPTRAPKGTEPRWWQTFYQDHRYNDCAGIRWKDKEGNWIDAQPNIIIRELI